MNRRQVLIFSLIAGVLTACAGPSTPEATTTPDQTKEALGTSEAVTEAALDAQSTSDHATKDAEDAEATSIAATAEQERALRQTATADAVVAATAQAGSFLEVIQTLQSEGHIETTTGRYYTLSDFHQSWAQINWYQWYYTDYSPANFVIRADAEWESASVKANFWNSGCGFVFREDGVDNHYVAYLGMDGYVYFARNVRGVYSRLGSSYYGKLDVPADAAELMLAVDGTKITFFVDGDRVHTRTDQGLSEGTLALTLLSGINTDFGTRCRMTNIELWELD